MTDLISKQAAINTTYNMCSRWDGEDPDDLRNMMLTAFQELPTIDPVKHGKWIKPTREPGWSYNEKAYAECSACGAKEFLGWEMRYCPNCGSKNEVNE